MPSAGLAQILYLLTSLKYMDGTMNRISLTISFFLTFASTVGHAAWMSAIDKKYASGNPSLYAQVAKADALISNSNGRTDLNIQAVNLLQKVLEKDQKFAPAYIQLGQAALNIGYQKNNDFDETALQSTEYYLQKALALEPNYDYALALMGYVNLSNGNLVEAEKYYKKAEILGSRYPFLKAQLAQLESRRGNCTAAIQYAMQGYNDNKPDSKVAAKTIVEVINAYQCLPENHNKEIEEWEIKRTSLDPSVAWYWGDHANFRLYYLGDYENAIKYSQKALSLMNYGVARYILAGAYYKKWTDLKDNKSRQKEANEAWNMGQSLHPDTSDMIQEFWGSSVLHSTAKALSEKAQLAK